MWEGKYFVGQWVVVDENFIVMVLQYIYILLREDSGREEDIPTYISNGGGIIIPFLLQ